MPLPWVGSKFRIETLGPDGVVKGMTTELDLVGLMYDAVADAARWPSFLESLVRATNATRGSLTLGTPRIEEVAIVCWYGWRDEDYPLYLQRYMKVDPWAKASLLLTEGVVSTSEDLSSPQELEASAAYREFYAPRGCHHGMGGTILRNATSISFVIVVRDRTMGPFGERELSILRPLMPHLRRAALLHGELASLRSQLAAFSGHLDRYPQALLLIDSECHVLYVNSAGREVSARCDGITIKSGQLLVMSPAKDAQMRTAVDKMVKRRDSSFHRLDINRSSSAAPYRVLLMPLPESGAVPLGVVQPAVAVLILDSSSSPQADPAALRELFSLTAAEARVTALLVGGHSLAEAASQLNVSIETIRTHTRRVLSKTATKRQGELISLVLRTMPLRPI
jgi:DNA-binding CsgD family transcriptional regulator